MNRLDIRTESEKEKFDWYKKITEFYNKGEKVEIEEHLSGFPAVTVDCKNIHLLTDILSAEKWWRKWRLGTNKKRR